MYNVQPGADINVNMPGTSPAAIEIGISGGRGKKGGYYTPVVQEGVLQWEASDPDMPQLPNSTVLKDSVIAALNGYVFFEVNDAGHLIMTKTEAVSNLDFRLNNGRLEVVYG